METKHLVYICYPAADRVIVERFYISEATIIEKMMNDCTIIRPSTNQLAVVLPDDVIHWVDVLGS